MNKRIVIIGGGTGTYTALMGLKKYPVNLSVIVSMADSGGSNRILRDEFGLLPTSDIRQAIVALSSDRASDTLRKLFTYRYSHGTGITGMTFGNLFMAALADIYGSQEKAIAQTCRILKVKGQIIPVTYDRTNLVATYEDGVHVLGEHESDEPDTSRLKHHITQLSVFPLVRENPAAVSAIKKADLILIGPGDLYTSLISDLVIGNLAQSIMNSSAKVVLVMNLMTRTGQTDGYTAKQHLNEINRYLGGKRVDAVLINRAKPISRLAKVWYAKAGSVQVLDDLKKSDVRQMVRTNLISEKTFVKNPSDKLIRSLIRHDSDKLGRAVIDLLK